MPNLARRLIFAGLILLFPACSEVEEKKLIFTTPNAFLGGPPISRLDYITGVLDTLYFVKKNGTLDQGISKCLFEGGKSMYNHIGMCRERSFLTGRKCPG